MKCNIVIARYNEDIDWMQQFANHPFYTIHLYDKGTPITSYVASSLSNLICHKLPNIGRESHTYLAHIIDNYDAIAATPEDVTFFTQAGIESHILIPKSSTLSLWLDTITQETRKMGYSLSQTSSTNSCLPEHRPLPEFRITEWPIGTKLTPNARDDTFGTWFERCLQQRLPPLSHFLWTIGAIFAVRHDRIASFPKTYYETLQAEHNGRNPEVSHFFERCWYYIFTHRPLYVPSPSLPEDQKPHPQPRILLLQIDTRALPKCSDFLEKQFTFPEHGSGTDDIMDIRRTFIVNNNLTAYDSQRRMRKIQKPQPQQQPLFSTGLPYYALTSAYNKQQSKNHSNVTYRYIHVQEIPGRCASWVKYRTIISHWDTDIKDFDIVVVLDTDAWVKDMNRFLQWMQMFVAKTDKTFLYAAEPYCSSTFKLENIEQQVNGGFTAFKPSSYSLQTLKEIYDIPETNHQFYKYKKEWSYEQICINYKLSVDRVFKESVIITPVTLFNTPSGKIVRHCWWKELIEPMIIPDLISLMASD